MRVYVSGLSLGPANFNRQVFPLARNVVEESRMQESGRIVGHREVDFRFARQNEAARAADAAAWIRSAAVVLTVR